MAVLTETLFVKAFDGTIREWTEIGLEPWLDSIDTNNRLEAVTRLLEHAYFTFQNSSITDPIKAVRLAIYAKGEIRNVIQVEIHDGLGNVKTVDLGAPSDTAYDWASRDLLGFLDTWDKVNGCKIKIRKEARTTTAQLNVDNFTGRINEWIAAGLSPWLNAADDGNYIYAKLAGSEIGDFTFEDLPKPWAGGTVTINVYCKGDGNDYVEVYVYDGTAWIATPYTITPDSVYSVKSIDVSDFLNSETKINSAMVYFVKRSTGTPADLFIDHVYIEATIYDEGQFAIAACKLEVDYYEGGVWVTKNPSSTEELEAGWGNPEGAYIEDDTGYAEASASLGEQAYGNYDLPSEEAEEVYEVHVLIDGYEDDKLDVVGVSISVDGGATWGTELIAQLNLLAESTKDLDFTPYLDLTPSNFSNANFKVKIRKGTEGCLLPESKLALWIEDEEERKKFRDECKYVTCRDLVKMKPDKLPKLLGYDETKKEFRAASITKIQVLKGDFDCYRIVCKDRNGYEKRAVGTGDHRVWEWFSGLKKLRDVVKGDVLGGLYWNEEKENYELRPVWVEEVKAFRASKCIHLETDCKHIFTFAIKASLIKW